MMRISFFITAALLVVGAVGVPAAHADTYQYTFTFSSSYFSGEATPIVFDTTGPISFGTVYAPISGSLGSDGNVVEFFITGGPGEEFINANTATVVTETGTLEMIPLITTGSEIIPSVGVGAIGTHP